MKKNLLNIMMGCMVLLAMWSCSEHYDLYSLKEDRLNFVYPKGPFNEVDSIKRFTFFYSKTDAPVDTVWIDFTTMGFLSEEDRAFELEQVEATWKDSFGELKEGEAVKNAEPGVHYVAFDDPEMKKFLFVKGGENKARIPILLKRDPSLETERFYLKFQVKQNENFVGSFDTNKYFVVQTTEMLVRPAQWDMMLEYYWTGPYGLKKFKFIVETANWEINEEWFIKNFSNPNTIDMGYTSFLAVYFTNKLIELNKERIARGEDVLKEDDGTIVRFTNFGTEQPYI